MAAFIVIQVAMIRDGQASRNRRSSVDADSPSMMYRHLQQSLFLLIDIPLELTSQNLSFSNAISAPKIFSTHAISEISYQQAGFNLGSKEGKGAVLRRDSAAVGCRWIGMDNHRRGAGQGKERVIW